MKRFLLQAVQNEDHLTPVREVFGLPNLNTAIVSTAFMTASGLSLLAGVLGPIADKTRLFVGIRNGVTTVQSIQYALDIGCETYMVDTATRQRIFHPKLYYARSAARAKLLLGSANLTMGGLRTNIEASVMQTLDPVADAAFLTDLEDKLNEMIANYPENVIRAVDTAQLINLQRSGRLRDEQRRHSPEPAGISIDRSLDTVPSMNLHTNAISGPVPPVVPVVPAAPVALEQVWESKGLTRRDLNIPTGPTTNPTGSMLLSVGSWTGIDQRHYFRDDVFVWLDWIPDTTPGKAHIERAEAQIRLIIKGVDYGDHTLLLSHNTLTDTPAYQQSNSMTNLHWGEVTPLVAHEDLLERVMKLFRETENPTYFTLEID